MRILPILVLLACGGGVDCDVEAEVVVHVVDAMTDDPIRGADVEVLVGGALVACEPLEDPGVFACLAPVAAPTNVYASAGPEYQAEGLQVEPSCDAPPLEIRLTGDLGGA